MLSKKGFVEEWLICSLQQRRRMEYGSTIDGKSSQDKLLSYRYSSSYPVTLLLKFGSPFFSTFSNDLTYLFRINAFCSYSFIFTNASAKQIYTPQIIRYRSMLHMYFWSPSVNHIIKLPSSFRSSALDSLLTVIYKSLLVNVLIFLAILSRVQLLLFVHTTSDTIVLSDRRGASPALK